jgi:hypothetical protein
MHERFGLSKIGRGPPAKAHGYLRLEEEKVGVSMGKSMWLPVPLPVHPSGTGIFIYGSILSFCHGRERVVSHLYSAIQVPSQAAPFPERLD